MLQSAQGHQIIQTANGQQLVVQSIPAATGQPVQVRTKSLNVFWKRIFSKFFNSGCIVWRWFKYATCSGFACSKHHWCRRPANYVAISSDSNRRWTNFNLPTRSGKSEKSNKVSFTDAIEILCRCKMVPRQWYNNQHKLPKDSKSFN